MTSFAMGRFHIRKILEGVDAIKHAGQCQRVEHCPSLGTIVRYEEQ